MPTSVPDNQGLMCAFRLAPVAACGTEMLADAAARSNAWLHFNLNDARARRWIDQQSGLPEDARALLLDSDPRTSLRMFPDGFVAVIGDLNHDVDHRALDADASAFSVLRVYVDAQRVISGRHHPLKTVDALRRELADTAGDLSSIELFERIVDRLAELYSESVAELGAPLDEVEDQILGGNFQRQTSGLSRGRRLLARLRRQMGATITTLAPLSNAPLTWCSTEQYASLAQALAKLTGVAQDLEYVQERSRLLQEEIANRLSETTNRNLYLLSIVTTSLLPITLITGIFGMNVGGLPWSHDARGFDWAMLSIVAMVGVTLAWLHKRGVM